MFNDKVYKVKCLLFSFYFLDNVNRSMITLLQHLIVCSNKFITISFLLR